MSDLISRQAAIDAIKALWDGAPTAQHVSAMFDCEDVIQALPSVHPEQQRLSDWKNDFKGYINALDLPRDDYNVIMEYIDEVPSAQPNLDTALYSDGFNDGYAQGKKDAQQDLDEWCTDCKEYDKERHCCPRYNRVIRDAVEEAKEDDWIPCSEQMPDEDYWTGNCVQHSAEVLMTVCSVADKKRIIDLGHANDGKWYSDRTDCFVPPWWEVIAWMPLPKPWKGEKDENSKLANQAEMQRP